MALGDIQIYSKDNGTGYPGDVNYVVGTAATVPQILAGEPVTKVLGTGSGTTLAYATALASAKPVIIGYAGNPSSDVMLGIAATTSTEGTSGNVMGAVSVTPIDEPLTYLIGTLQTSAFFGTNSTAPSQAAYDAMVGSRVTFARTGGVGSSQLGGVYTINATDATGNGLIVEELDILRFPGKVRFSIRSSVSYRA